MVRQRPALTPLAVDEPVRGRPGRPTELLEAARLDEDDREATDALEASCDIGETTLSKGSIHINRAGVSFAPRTNHRGRRGEDRDDEGSSAAGEVALRQLVSLDELEVCGLVGRGCSGQVLRATHRASRELFAVKVVRNVHDKAKRDQLLTEIRTLYGVESPFLVSCYGAYFQDCALSLVLEHCALGSLDRVLLASAGRGMPERVAAQLAFQVLSGLAHLKRARHFHRDVKPQNILVQPGGAVKLTDFGLARELGGSLDMASTFVGTFKYMSPERIQNQPYDYKSDVWSLGLVLIECATAAFPYRSASSYIDVVQSIIEGPEPSLPRADADGEPFSAEFRQFLGCCLKKDPAKRASVEVLLSSPWLRLHDATERSACVSRCAEWLATLRHGTSSQAKTTDDDFEGDDYADDEFEGEEDGAEEK